MGNLIIGVYIIYAVSITISTIYVARTLFTNSKTFMHTIFNGREELANATNKLFETGFFLLAFGLGLWYMQTDRNIYENREFFEVLSVKLGGFIIFLGILLFFNLYMFFRGMKHRNRKISPPDMPITETMMNS